VTLSGILSIHTSQSEMTARIGEFQKKSASLVAQSVTDFLEEAIQALKLSTRLIPFDQFPEDELPNALMIPYRQFDYVNIVALLDREGKQLAGPAFETRPEKTAALESHESVTVEEVGEFARHIPLKAALATGAAIGPAYFNARTRAPRAAVAIAFPVKGNKDTWVMAVELSLRGIQERILATAPQGGIAFLADGQGRVVCHTDASLAQERASLSKLPILASGMKEKKALSRRYLDLDGREMAGAFAPVPPLGWGLVLAQPEEVAFLAARRIRTYALFWVLLSLFVAVFGGILFARGVSRPVRDLAAGAMDVAKGDFDKKIPVRSRDEIGKLAETFNHMAYELKQSSSTISDQLVEIWEKNMEIQRWNEELNQRVKKRTRELREAQEQITRSQKLAAIGELGAGIAHEVNNPLSGIQGFAQLMLGKTKPGEPFYKHLKTIEVEAKKIKHIIANLLRFSHSPENRDHTQVILNDMVESALQLVQSRLGEKEISVEKNLQSDLPPISGDYLDIQQVCVHLINNAMNAMSTGGTITLETEEIEGGAVRLAISDTGQGILEENLDKIFDPFFTTKDEWTAKGLGLSVVNQIVREHNGMIRAESEVGRGSTFVVVFPGIPKKLHLR
jgi:signal transduction histidine kinase